MPHQDRFSAILCLGMAIGTSGTGHWMDGSTQKREKTAFFLQGILYIVPCFDKCWQIMLFSDKFRHLCPAFPEVKPVIFRNIGLSSVGNKIAVNLLG
jgi:hypothetical protein